MENSQRNELLENWGPRARVTHAYAWKGDLLTTRTRDQRIIKQRARVIHAHVWCWSRDSLKGKILGAIFELKEAQIQLISDAFEPKEGKGLGETHSVVFIML